MSEPESKPESSFQWLHMVAIAIVYGVMIFIACSLIWQTNIWSMYFAYALLVPCLFIFGFWAALGPGILWLRVVVFSSLGPLLAVAGVAGLAIFPSNGGIVGFESSSGSALVMVFMAAFAVCVACQIPYWFFRIVFGWQLIQENRDWREKKISLKDIFFLTAVFAVGIALPGYAVNIFNDVLADQIKVGYTEMVPTDEMDADGVPLEFKSVLVTEENIKEIKELRKSQADSGMLMGVFAYAAVTSVLSFLFVPVVVLSLRKSGTWKGVGVAALYLMAICLAAVFFNVLLFSGLTGWIQLLNPYLYGFGTTLVAAAMIPIVFSRGGGFRLASRRDFQARIADRSADVAANVQC